MKTQPTIRGCGLALLVSLLISLSVQSQDESLEDLKKLQAEYTELIEQAEAVIRDKDRYSETDVIDAKSNRDRFLRARARLEDEMRSRGGSPGRVVTVPAGSEVTAVDTESGARAVGTLENKCEQARTFERPVFMLYQLPPFNQQSGKKRKIAVQLLATETVLVEHLTECREAWTLESALAWDADRKALIDRLLYLEDAYAMVFVAGYSKEENQLLQEAYEETPRLPALNRQIDRLYADYMEKDAVAKELIRLFKDSIDITTRMWLQQMNVNVREARGKWREAENDRARILGAKMDVTKQVREMRKLRGARTMNALYEDIQFDFHTAEQFEGTQSPLIALLLGDAGLEILVSQSVERRRAVRSAYGR
ncbi:MAG: hypothetical protein AAGI88_00130 [Pseudomonadota bacterium]